MVSEPDQVGAEGDQFDFDWVVTTSFAAEELQKMNILALQFILIH